jgi:hypothetical protein
MAGERQLPRRGENANARAIACIAAASSASASSTTASGLPAKRRSVNTSRVAKRRRMKVSYGRPDDHSML